MSGGLSTRTYWIALGLIFLAGMTARVVQLDEIPNGFFCDEASNGYKAYSLLTTGKDTYGESFPIFFRHHEKDFIEGLYTYVSIPFVWLFGLNVFATRLPAALAGSLTILATAALTRELFGNRYALVAALLTAFSPWLFVFSRVAFRGILLPLSLTTSVWCLLRSLKDYRWWIPCGALFGLTLHTYSIAKLLVPMVMALGLILFWPHLRHEVKKRDVQLHLAVASLAFAILAIPVYGFSFFGDGNTRFIELSIFSRPEPVSAFFTNFLKHLSPTFLLLTGDPNLRHGIGSQGVLLWITAPFLLLGVYAAVRSLDPKWMLAPILSLLGLVPAAVTAEGLPHALRSVGSSTFLVITAVSGLSYLFRERSFHSRMVQHVAVGLIAIAFGLNASSFISSYFGEYKPLSRFWFQYGMEEAVATAEAVHEEFDYIAFGPSIRQPDSFVMFWARPDPAPYQQGRDLAKYIDSSGGLSLPGRYLLILPANTSIGVGGAEQAEKVLHEVKGKDGTVVLKLVRMEIPGRDDHGT